MKRTLIFLSVLAATFCLRAQEFKSLRSMSPLQQSANTFNSQTSITPTSSQLWWGYFSDTEAQGLYLGGGIGYGSATTIDAAIFVPANHSFVGKSTIKACRFWLGQDVTKISSDVKFWISKTMPSDVSNSDYVQVIPKSSLNQGVNEVELTTPFAVNNSEIYIGITFSISERAYPIMSNGDDNPFGFYYRCAGEWINFNGYGYGKLALQVLIDGGTYPTNCAEVEDFGQNIVVKGNNASIPVKITNTGKDPITSIAYTITTAGGNTTAEKTLQLSSLSYNSTKTLYIPFTSDNETKKYLKTFTISKVNGVPNTAEDKDGTGYLITIIEKPSVMPVVEEFTGTWCGYCPYGIVGLQEVHETFGDKVALIAAHSGDVMQINAYSSVISKYAGGYPSSSINRETSAYPYNFNNYVSSALSRTTQGKIDLTAMWNDENKNAIQFNTKTTFSYSDDKGQYGIALVLVEDGLTGTTSAWSQSNYLSGGSGDSNMQFWYDSASIVSGIEYNHVAVEGWGVLSGINSSIAPTFQAGTPISFNYVGNISTNTLIQDKTKLKAIALLIDIYNGKIVNAAQTTIQNFNPSGIVNITSNSVDENDSYYTINGRKLYKRPTQKGVYIVNGKKVVIK